MKCGCRVIFNKPPLEKPVIEQAYKIVFCPMHEAAERMLKATRNLLDYCYPGNAWRGTNNMKDIADFVHLFYEITKKLKAEGRHE